MTDQPTEETAPSQSGSIPQSEVVPGESLYPLAVIAVERDGQMVIVEGGLGQLIGCPQCFCLVTNVERHLPQCYGDPIEAPTEKSEAADAAGDVYSTPSTFSDEEPEYDGRSFTYPEGE